MSPQDLAAMQSRIETPHERGYRGGTPSLVHPQLVDQVWGDGQRVIALTTYAQSPDYYVVRIDSSWDLDAPDGLRAHMDEIMDSIEGQFDAILDGDPPSDWPMADFSLGSSWGDITSEILHLLESDHG